MGGSVSAHSTAPPPSPFVVHPSPVTPDFETGKKSADPNFGFDGKKRKERAPPVTPEELASAKVPLEWRDFCAHKYIEFQKCRRDEFPFLLRCKHQKHELEHCQNDEYTIRLKEYERERRLLHRKQRKEEKAAREAKEVC